MGRSAKTYAPAEMAEVVQFRQRAARTWERTARGKSICPECGACGWCDELLINRRLWMDNHRHPHEVAACGRRVARGTLGQHRARCKGGCR